MWVESPGRQTVAGVPASWAADHQTDVGRDCMEPSGTTFLVMDLSGMFAFALNGAWTAMRVARLDIVGVLVLGILTAQGGGFLRDVLLGALPPATFSDWRYLTVAALGSLIAFISPGSPRPAGQARSSLL